MISSKLTSRFCLGIILGSTFTSIRKSNIISIDITSTARLSGSSTRNKEKERYVNYVSLWSFLPYIQQEEERGRVSEALLTPEVGRIRNIRRQNDMQTPPPATSNANNDLTIGQQIVETAYDWAYKDIITYCPDTGYEYFISTNVPEGRKFQDFRGCLESTYKFIVENSTLANSYPWWFMTLLRDSADRKTGLLGHWNYKPLSQEVSTCTIEKVGSKQWDKVFLNQQKNQVNPLEGNTDRKFIFIRDPLDRFLSAFLNKCVNKYIGEPHCEPREFFQEEDLIMEKAVKTNMTSTELDILRENLHSEGNENLVSDFRKKIKNTPKRLLFEAYVDAFPLKWNRHFIPQSFTCGGLYNTFKHYDFRGYMGIDFYDDLRNLTKQYPSIKESVDLIFELDEQRMQQKLTKEASNNNTQETTSNTGNNVGVETKAASKVLQYYTAKTVRKVLEYASIDYKMLDMTIPKWAEDFLLKEEKEQARKYSTMNDVSRIS